VGAELFHCGRTDRHDEANIWFLQFYERAKNGHEVNTIVTEWLITRDVAFCYKGIEKLLSGKGKYFSRGGDCV
jgi:hypothetical protein